MGVQDDALKAQNVYLIRLLEKAGIDAARRDIAERIQSVLTEELHHRMKNMLTMVTSIVRQSIRSATSLEEAEKAIATRLIAMGKAHDLLLEVDWKTAKLTNVIKGALQQHKSDISRIDVSGPEIEISSAAILPLTLVLNELSTNATKYGALSNDKGFVSLNWSRNPVEKTISFRWTEKDGPCVSPPRTRGFGSRLIEEALPRQLGGTGKLSFQPSGVEFEFILPDRAFLAADLE
jgi:two-component sensor histidine kinase